MQEICVSHDKNDLRASKSRGMEFMVFESHFADIPEYYFSSFWPPLSIARLLKALHPWPHVYYVLPSYPTLLHPFPASVSPPTLLKYPLGRSKIGCISELLPHDESFYLAGEAFSEAWWWREVSYCQEWKVNEGLYAYGASLQAFVEGSHWFPEQGIERLMCMIFYVCVCVVNMYRPVFLALQSE